MRKRELFNLSPQPRKLQSLATTLLVSKVVDAMVGLVLVLVETTAWLVAWRSSHSPLAPIFLLLPTPLSSFFWLATRSRTKNSGQVWLKRITFKLCKYANGDLLAGTRLLLDHLASTHQPTFSHHHV